MPRTRKTSLSVEGWYCLVIMGFILAGAMLRQINLLIVLFCLMLGPFLLSWRHVVVSLRKLQVRRRAPSSLAAGDLLVVDIEAENRRRRGVTWALVVEDQVLRLSEREKKPVVARALFPRLPAGQTQRQAYEGQLTGRGEYRLGPLKVSTRFPLGLIRRWFTVEQFDTLIVYPRCGALTPKWARRRQHALHGSRPVRRRQGVHEGEFHSLRDYRPGDSQRWVHWRTTARLGELTVRQFEQQDNYDLALFLDLWIPDKPDQQARENVELAVSFAATVSADHCRRGTSLFSISIAGTRNSHTRGPASMMLMDEAMRRLALAEADHRDRLPEVLDRGLEQIPARCDVVIVSTRRQDLADTERFATVWADPRKRSWATRALCVDTSSDALFEYFTPKA